MIEGTGWIMDRIRLSPRREAVIDISSGDKWTYADLKERILRWTAFFNENGYPQGERVAVLAPNQPDLFALLFACEVQGLLFVPLNWRLHQAELQVLLRDCEPVVLLFDRQFESLVQQTGFSETMPLTIVEETDVLLKCPDSTIYEGDESPWMMLYTGGTTGAPKGVVLSKKAVNWNALNTIASWGLTEEDRTINYMPLFHTGGLNALSIPILMAGGTVVLGRQFDEEEALRATNRYEATISLFVPTMYQAIIQTPYFQQASFPSMKVFLSGGAPCPHAIYEAFQHKGVSFKEGYGLTEAGPNNFFIRPEVACQKIGSVGKSMLFNQVQVVNEQGKRCRTGEVGELCVKGPHLFSGYWRKPEETAAAIQSGWLRTGDLAKMDEDGDHFIVGRKKELIITGGENVYPQEVEQYLLRMAGIREAVVIGLDDDKWGEVVVAYLTLRDGATVTEEDVIAHCKKALGGFKVPKEVHFLEALPTTPVGKIDKKALQKSVRSV
ncbi:long-chain fatty acid--CoA ligase [Sporosarcina sp. 179-K 3D1 HS]|uniref:acyl-CoA synthetase n=1 Tax=Sporosarcina sp. 179-K 3D1 HS TaxID=3232169 RepID=UPI0039A25A18